MTHHLVVRVVSKLLIPSILLFGLYVQFHADFGPGGGFQAGVIFAAAFILYALVYGLDNARRVLPDHWVRIGAALGVILFVGTGYVSLFLGHNFLDYDPLASNPVHGQLYGILAVEFGVGLTVASVMVAIFFAFAGRGHKIDEMEG